MYIVIQKSSAVFPIVLKEHESVVNEGIVEGNWVFLCLRGGYLNYSILPRRWKSSTDLENTWKSLGQDFLP